MGGFGHELMGTPVWAWLAFLSLVLALLVFDLGVLHRKPHAIGGREALLLSAFYIAIGLMFAGWIYVLSGPDGAIDYVTGFLVEKSLAMDNIFVIATIFAYFAIPARYQHRVLIYGIIGVVLLRGIMIGIGAAAVHEFEWVLYLFALFLVVAGVKMMFLDENSGSIENNRLLRFLQRRIPVTDRLHGERFFVRQRPAPGAAAVRVATPLFVALVMVEIADVIFAVDSIPAIFAITTDPYIVYTSNIFAILGLRALYFALAVVLARFEYMKYALALILVFIGGKVLAVPLLGIDKVPSTVSLAVTVAMLLAGAAYSMWRTRKEPHRGATDRELAAGVRPEHLS